MKIVFVEQLRSNFFETVYRFLCDGEPFDVRLRIGLSSGAPSLCLSDRHAITREYPPVASENREINPCWADLPGALFTIIEYLRDAVPAYKADVAAREEARCIRDIEVKTGVPQYRWPVRVPEDVTRLVRCRRTGKNQYAMLASSVRRALKQEKGFSYNSPWLDSVVKCRKWVRYDGGAWVPGKRIGPRVKRGAKKTLLVFGVVVGLTEFTKLINELWRNIGTKDCRLDVTVGDGFLEIKCELGYGKLRKTMLIKDGAWDKYRGRTGYDRELILAYPD